MLIMLAKEVLNFLPKTQFAVIYNEGNTPQKIVIVGDIDCVLVQKHKLNQAWHNSNKHHKEKQELSNQRFHEHSNEHYEII